MQGPAPVYSIADERRSHAEAAAWSRFTAPGDSQDFFGAWLALLCSRVERVRAALLLVGEAGEGGFKVAAAWPDLQRDLQYLGPTAQRALTDRAGVVAPAPGGSALGEAGAHVGYPVEVAGRLCAAVVLDVGGGSQAELQWALRQVHWASAWLVDHFRKQALQAREAELARVDTLNTLMATAMQHRRSQPSALSIANELAPRFGCDRVSIGFEDAGRVVPLVMSHTAVFDLRSDLVRTVGEAMDEVLDLGVAVAFPPPDDD